MSGSLGKARQFQPMPRQTLADKVYAMLRQSLLNGEIADGSELNQVDLAEQFGVSRVPVREALRRLQAERLLVAMPYQRYTVPSVSPEEILEFIELREELEVFALHKTFMVLREGSLDVANIERQLSGQSTRLSGERWLQADYAFHHLLHPTAAIDQMIGDIRERIHRYLQHVVSRKPRREQAIEEHWALFKALIRDDEPEAERILRAHVQRTRTMIHEYLVQVSSDEQGASAAAKEIPRNESGHRTGNGIVG